MIKPIEIFSQNPGRIADFSGVPVAEIFNGSVLARAQAMEREMMSEEEKRQREEMETARTTPQTLFAPERGAELFGMPQQSAPPSAAQPTASTTPGSYPEFENYDMPMATATPMAPEDFTFEVEAQRDAKGQLKVFTPPAGDGGGAFEIAGITAQYQPKEAARLKSLIESGQSQQAEAEAKDYYRRRAAPFTGLTENRGLQLQFSDTVQHRGEGGLRRILQRATGSNETDYAKLVGMLSSDSAALDKFNQARQSYEWQEVDRGRESRKKFRKGLQNRFNKADAAARSLITRE